MNPDGSKARFLSEFDVSRETLDQLQSYADLLRKWTPSINLVAKSTLDSLWERHFLDSAQLFKAVKLKTGHWVDVGAGGGFPGLVLAILAKEKRPGLKFSLVECDRRKSVFLETVIRELSLSSQVYRQRIEEIRSFNADILSARALAPLPKLLEYAERHLNSEGQAVFLKGSSFRTEVSEALELWSFQSQEYPSITDRTAAVLCLGEIKRV